MKVITVELDLGMDFFDFKLSLSKKACFKICDCYYSNYHWDEFGKYIQASVYITAQEEADSDITIGELAIKKIKRANAIMSYLYGFYFETHLVGYDSYKEVEEIKHVEYLPKTGNGKRIREFNEKFNDLDQTDRTDFEQCCRLLSMGIYFIYKYNFYEDALLNFTKIMEKISTKYWETKITNQFKDEIKQTYEQLLNKYFCEAYDESSHKGDLKNVTREFKNMINLKRKLVKFAKDKKISVIIDENSDIKEHIKEIVKFRNDVAHGNLIYRSESVQNYINRCGYVLALEYISEYFFKAEYLKIGLNKTIE
ncbi:HEPN domain-containing protein [Dethiothermospora halolimnae]|uniref:HEPN domain-containing protein n=1 Tax=Dethiothermospora halolimnae TaxID=3114390 RepID=UPI003CCBF8B2